MITKLTPEQWGQLPEYIDKWVKMASGETDVAAANLAVTEMYRKMGIENQPLILHFTSPAMCQLASALICGKLRVNGGGQLHSQLHSQLNSQLDTQVRSQLHWQLESQLCSQLNSQLYSQLNSQLDTQVRSQLHWQLESQLDTQVRSQLNTQLSPQLDTQLHSQLRSQLDTQLYSQLNSQLNSQLYSQLNSQLESQLCSQHIIVRWLVWAGFYDFSNFIGVKFNTKILKIFTQFVSNIHFCLPYENLFIYSHKPTQIHWRNRRLHNESGMAVEYADGWGWYCLNGVPMKSEYVLTPPGEIAPEIIIQEKDVDVRRELLRKVGVMRMKTFGASVEKTLSGEYELLDMSKITGMPNEMFLLMMNPSVPDTWHLEAVPRDCKTIEQALHMRKPPEMRKIPISKDGENWYQQGDVAIWPQGALALKKYPTVLT